MSLASIGPASSPQTKPYVVLELLTLEPKIAQTYLKGSDDSLVSHDSRETVLNPLIRKKDSRLQGLESVELTDWLEEQDKSAHQKFIYKVLWPVPQDCYASYVVSVTASEALEHNKRVRDRIGMEAVTVITDPYTGLPLKGDKVDAFIKTHKIFGDE